MFIKTALKWNKAAGERKAYYRLCQSYRWEGTVRHHTILHLGALDELDEAQRDSLCSRIASLVEDARTGMKDLFVPQDETVEALAQRFFAVICKEKRLDLTPGKDWQQIDTGSVKNKNIREVGAEWLCMQAAAQLKVADFLKEREWTQEDIRLALTHIISRASYPASELRTSRWIRENSAVCELTGYEEEKITKDKLYGISHGLYAVKDELEKHLSKRTNELFDLDDKIIIYDLTNTYFEGKKQGSLLAQYGRSKEKRSDARLVVLAVVVNAEGFLKYSQIFEGNTADSATLEKIIDALSKRTSLTGRKPVVVIDAGIATDDNIGLLQNRGFDYMCVSRSGLKKYKAGTGSQPVIITDNRQQPITLQKVTVEGYSDRCLLVHSAAKEAKEASMNSKFAERYQQGLTQIKASLTKKSGIKRQQKVWERIGRLKAQYPSIHRHYDIEVKADRAGIVTEITWKQKRIEKKEGQYLLRTNLDEQDERTQWTIYNTIREVEAAFRLLKTDLHLRPVFHKNDDATMAHLHLGLLAYWVVNTIRHQLKQKGINNEWRDITRVMNTQKVVTTTMENERKETVTIRQCSEPSEAVKKIYDALSYKPKPFTRRKFVVPTDELKKTQTPALQEIRPG